MKKKLRIFGIIFLVFAAVITCAVWLLPLPGNPTVLMYHFIGTDQDAKDSNNFVSLQAFKNQMAFLDWLRYRVLTLEEYYEIRAGRKPSRGREVLITFDDGNYTFETLAYPVLEKHKFPAAVFLVSDNVTNNLHGSMSREVLEGILPDGLVSFGSHSRTHPFLNRLSPEQLQSELAGSKTDLEAILGREVKDFAYPYGVFDRTVRDAAQAAGYRMAFTTSPKKLEGLGEDLFSVTRTKVTRSSDYFFIFWVKVSGIYQWTKSWRHERKQERGYGS